jgi:DNA-binding transcriptional regulator YdaS (Cro superfamily)
MTVKDIIKSLGGPALIAGRIGIRPQAISLWAIKGRIPAQRVPQLERMARELGKPIRAEQMRPDIDWGVLRGLRD